MNEIDMVIIAELMDKISKIEIDNGKKFDLLAGEIMELQKRVSRLELENRKMNRVIDVQSATLGNVLRSLRIIDGLRSEDRTNTAEYGITYTDKEGMVRTAIVDCSSINVAWKKAKALSGNDLQPISVTRLGGMVIDMDKTVTDVEFLASVIVELLVIAKDLRLITEKQEARISVLEKTLGIGD